MKEHNQCEYIAIHKGNIACYIQTAYEGAKYYCNQCDFIATPKGNLACHIQSVYEGDKYECR